MDEAMQKAYDARHKQAFRVAFDALKEVFPPDGTGEYWEKTHETLRAIYIANKDNPLCRTLLVAVENYLGIAEKELKDMQQ